MTDDAYTLEPTDGVFDFRQGPAFAKAYLRTYYAQPPTADERAVLRFLATELRERPLSGRLMELGCGPTVHHVLPFAPFVQAIDMADYLEENLAEVRAWRDGSAEAHDWRGHTRQVLEYEGTPATDRAVVVRERLMRARIEHLVQVDLKRAVPRERVARYDAVGCFYCAEEIGISLDAWRTVLGRVVDHLKPGGRLFMAALAGMDSYVVRAPSGQRVEYPCACLREDDVGDALVRLGFPAGSVRLQTQRIAEPDCEVDGAILVAATKG